MNPIRMAAAAALLAAGACAPAATAGADVPAAAEAPAQADGPRLLNQAEGVRVMRLEYPPLLRDAGVTGEVIVDALLAADGTVRSERMVRSTYDPFTPPALRAARQLRFAPPAQAGAVVRLRMVFNEREGRNSRIEVVWP